MSCIRRKCAFFIAKISLQINLKVLRTLFNFTHNKAFLNMRGEPMLTNEDYTERLKSLGYSNDFIKEIMDLYLINGEIDILEYYLSSDAVKN